MRRQTAVGFRCGNCRTEYPGRTPPALGYVERGSDGILRPYRLKRVGQPLRPFTLGVSPLGDARWSLSAREGQPPRGRTARFYEPESPILTLPCRDCRRTPPAEVLWEEYAILAFAQGLREVDV
jgi:hypothetical protein